MTGIRSLTRVAFVALLIVAVAAFATVRSGVAQDEVTVTISELNGSGVSGEAYLTDQGDGTTFVEVLVDGATGGHPIHIHAGTCEELGDIVVPLTDVDEFGESLTEVDLPLNTIVNEGPHAINIHLSLDEIETYVACGNIEPAVGGVAATDTTAETDDAAADGADDAVGGVTTAPATGIGVTAGANSAMMLVMMVVGAAMLFGAGFALRRSEVRA
jgi:hypothetical protein